MQSFIRGEISLHVLFGNDEPLFFGKEVAKILGYADTDGAIRRHVDAEDKLELRELNDPVRHTGLHPCKILINEIGLYSLVFGSELPQAKEFRRWVFSEVLPQIRKTGSYSLHDGLLKLRDISEEDVLKMEDSRKKEFRLELKRFQDLLKDPEVQRRSQIGGIALWRKIRQQEAELESLRKKVEDVKSIIED